jgi:tungstate transport system ATP-binding protein
MMLVGRTASAPDPGRGPLLPLVLDHVTLEIGGRRVLDNISFDLRVTERTIVLGPNGAGKSLLLRLCHGLMRPTSGSVQWATPDDAAQRQAFVFQKPVMLRRSALANVAYGLAVGGVGPRERRRRAREALERVGLGQLADRPARLLSGGEQQRVALARAWALDPEVLFLDEPTASLDPAATRMIEKAIQGMHEHGVKIVMVTHDLGQARRLADEVLFLHKGRLVERSPAASFFHQPLTPEAQAYLRGDLLV